MAKVVDLSHPLIPERERFTLSVRRYPVEEAVPEYTTPPGGWYIMSDITMCSHVGTHVEVPFHAQKDGYTIDALPRDRLVGEAVVVDFDGVGERHGITADEIDARVDVDLTDRIVLIKTGWSRYYGTATYRRRPYMTTDAVERLIAARIKTLGIDCSGIEDRSSDDHEPHHARLFAEGIPMIEDLNNLINLESQEAFFFALPLPIRGLDASPIRPIAVEPLTETTELRSIFGSYDTWIESTR